MTPETFEILFKIIMIIIGFYLAFFKSYFQQKGKNLATSEDIEELTLKVESVKQNFIEKNANLKAKLDLLTNIQINHKNDERKSLIDFHKIIKNWIGLLTESSPSLIDSYDNQEILNKIHQYELTYSKVLGAEAILELFVEDDKLNKLVYDLKMNILKHLTPNPSKFLIGIKHNNLEFEQNRKMPIDTVENIGKKSKEYEELLDKRDEIYKEYRTNMTKGYKQIIDFDKKYRTYMREYISKISTE
jgi:hypothetical protein